MALGVVSFGNQTASLRGLGGQYTLVLVNGKRLGSFAGGITGAEGVNLSAIPVSAIDRVEVLTDGASAIYGSDAIAGVINYIMRQDFTGADAMVQYGAPTRSGGGEQWILQGTLGAGDLAKDKYNAFVSIQYQEQKSLDQRDRNFSNTSYIPGQLDLTSFNSFPANVYDPATGAILGTPGYPNCEPSIAVNGLCAYDPARTSGVQSIPQQTQLNLYGSAQFQINADWKAYLTGMYSRSDNKFTIQPTPLSVAVAAPTLPGGAAEIIMSPRARITRISSPPTTASTGSRSACCIDVSFAATASTRTPTMRGRSSPGSRAPHGTGTGTGRSTTARTRPRSSPEAASSSSRRSFRF